MTKIIGHRGAKGLALENSPAAFQAVLGVDVDAVEFDVRRTRDGKLVVMHDRRTGRVAEQNVRVADKTLAELQSIRLKNGEPIPSLDDVLKILGQTPVLIEIKDAACAEEVLQTLSRHPAARASVTSFKRDELRLLHQRRPEMGLYVAKHLNPFNIARIARRLGVTGITLHKWMMNPLTYRMAERAGLTLFVYTVDSLRMARYFEQRYPNISICTNHPERFRRRRGIATSSASTTS